MILKQFRAILVYFIVPVILLSKPLIFSAECFMIEGDTTSPSMTYDMEAEKIEGLKDTSLIMFSDPEAFFEDNFSEYSKNFMSMKDIYEAYPNAASLRHHFYYDKADILFFNKRFYSLRYHHSWFTGGAHPNSTSEHWILRKKDGKILNYSDLFKPSADERLKTLIDKALLKKFKVPDLDQILFSKNYPVSSDIYLVKKGIVFQYDTYEIAPYYVGPVEIFLPYWKIHKLLRDF